MLEFSRGSRFLVDPEEETKNLPFCRSAKCQMTSCNAPGSLYIRKFLLRSGWPFIGLYHVNKAEHLNGDRPNPNL